MRVAVFSDVHGNLTALNAVLTDIAQQQVDQIVFAGDLCLAGPRPAECLQRVQAAEIPSVYGNTDDWVLGRQKGPEHVLAMSEWTLAQFSDTDRQWLDSLPLSHRISPTAIPSEDLLVVHANPKDAYWLIFPAETEQMKRYGRIRQPDTDLDEWLDGTEAAVLAYGHLHIPSLRQWNNIVLANISSLSIPGDGDARAKYGIFNWENGRWHIHHRRVSYDIQEEIDAYKTHQPPGWESIVEPLEDKGIFSQDV